MEEELYPHVEMSEEDVIDLSHQIFLQELTKLLNELALYTEDELILDTIKKMRILCENFK